MLRTHSEIGRGLAHSKTLARQAAHRAGKGRECGVDKHHTPKHHAPENPKTQIKLQNIPVPNSNNGPIELL